MRGLSALALLAACGSKAPREAGKDATPRPAPDAAVAVPVPVDAAPPPPVDAAPDTTIACGAVLPPALRAAHFPDMTMHETVAPRLPSAMCELTGKAAGQVAMVGVSCLDPATTAATVDFGRSRLTDVVDLQAGKRAFVGTVMGMKSLTLWDDDTGCVAVAAGFAGDVAALAAGLAAGLTAPVRERVEAHARTPPAEEAPAVALCDQLLPEAARTAHFPDAPMQTIATPGNRTVYCDNGVGSINVACVSTEHDATMRMLRDFLADPIDLPAGRAAQAGRDGDRLRLDLWDDAGCLVNAIGFTGDPAALAAALDAGLSPALTEQIVSR